MCECMCVRCFERIAQGTNIMCSGSLSEAKGLTHCSLSTFLSWRHNYDFVMFCCAPNERLRASYVEDGGSIPGGLGVFTLFFHLSRACNSRPKASIGGPVNVCELQISK